MKSRYFLTGAVIILILVAGMVWLKKSRPALQPSNVAASQKKSKGPAGAPIKIIEYSDFECPACRMAIPTVQSMMEAYPEKIYFTFHHYPLEGHKVSPLAHVAAECAAVQNKFWPYHDKLYQQQKIWTKAANPSEIFLRYAQENGLELDAFAKCLTDDKIRRQILLEKSEGEALVIRSTPTFFINGERVVGPMELKQKGVAKVREILGLPPLPTPPPAQPESAAVSLPERSDFTSVFVPAAEDGNSPASLPETTAPDNRKS